MLSTSSLNAEAVRYSMRRPDRQRARVYAWEDAHVAPYDPSFVLFAAAQGLVDAIWSEMGLRYPPKVESLPAQATATRAQANRLSIALPARTPSWVILHELAHAMTCSHDGTTDGHGSLFMGLYVQLLVRYLRLPRAALLQSLARAGIAVDADAKAVFVDLVL